MRGLNSEIWAAPSGQPGVSLLIRYAYATRSCLVTLILAHCDEELVWTVSPLKYHKSRPWFEMVTSATTVVLMNY